MNEHIRDKIRGCILGGAMGDALGYSVEFDRLPQILKQYGAPGITEYMPDPDSGVALISDDTQMSIFTACGVLVNATRKQTQGVDDLLHCTQQAYLDWLHTQNFLSFMGGKPSGYSWVLGEPKLHFRRAPGGTCLMALQDVQSGQFSSDVLGDPRNSRKGCGGVMRTAPLALYRDGSDILSQDLDAARLAAITHGHPLGYMPSAVLNHILRRLVYPEQSLSLREIIRQALDAVSGLFAGNGYLPRLQELLELAVTLADNDLSDFDNIRALGEGWVGEEALAIALYCAVRYEHNFSAGLIAAVNHDGDSDSTGAIAGNILGAVCGYDAIEPKWKDALELREVLLEIADDLHSGVSDDPGWQRKYATIHVSHS